MGRLGNVVVAVSFVLSIGLAAHTLSARSGGITGWSGAPDGNGGDCSACHSGGITPSVTISGPTSVAAGSTNLYTLTISGGQQTAGGLDVWASGGSFTAIDPGTREEFGEIVHNSPRAADVNGNVTFSFEWTAPPTPTYVDISGAGNSVNLNFSPVGDAPDTDAFTITVGGGSLPGEPAGAPNAPLRVTFFDDFTGDLYFDYGPACATTNNNVYFGPLSQVSTYGYTGELCGIGNSGFGFVNGGSGSYFFLIVGNRNVDEGSYGRKQVGGVETERPPYAGNLCGQMQALGSVCQ